MPISEPRVTLDRTGEPWVGTFRSLGSVRVWADGAATVEVDPAATDTADRLHDALWHGWATPLSLARQGHWLVNGVSVAPPDDHRALLVTGPAHDTAIVVIELVRLGWRLIADRPAPVRFTPDLVAHPRQAPFVMSARRARTSGLDGAAVRDRTDAVRVESFSVLDTPAPVGGIAVVSVRRPQHPVLQPLKGHAAIEASGMVLVGGVLSPEPESTPQAAMTRQLTLTRAGMVRLDIDSATATSDVAELVVWWSDR